MATATETAAIRSCELKLIKWIREHAVPHGTIQAALTVDYQDGVAVLIRVERPLQEEKLK